MLALSSGLLLAQEELQEKPQPPVIADEPKTIDPATLMPKPLAAKGTVKFEGQSLLEMAKWFATEHDLKVLFDKRSLDQVGVPLGEPVYDHLADEPIYLLLGRLKMLDLAWNFEDGLVRVMSQEDAESQGSTVPYNLGDLIDAGYTRDALTDAIISTIDTSSWAENGGGESDIQWLGDVMFVRQNEAGHEELLALLERYRAALRISKPRAEDKPDPNEMLTKYYRMPSQIAQGLASALPQLVAPTSWKSNDRPDAKGTIMVLPSESEVKSSTDKAPLVVPQSVLIIRQTRENHEAIADRIHKVRHGDAEAAISSGGFGSGGGFGGGAFSIEPDE